MAQKVHVGIVLDRSGSMEDCSADAIGAVNSYLRQVKEYRELEARVSLIIFDSQSIDVVRDRVAGARLRGVGRQRISAAGSDAAARPEQGDWRTLHPRHHD